MADEWIDERVSVTDPERRRVKSRARVDAVAEEAAADDPEAQARALLVESDERVADPAARDLDDPRVDRRTSDEATPPADAR